MKKIKTLFYLFFPLVIGIFIGLITKNQNDYQLLIKPPFSPPSFIFPIVWSILYLLMGFSYLLLKKSLNFDKKDQFFYYLQLLINFLWSIFFFTLKWRFWSILWIILLDIVLIYMINLFSKKNKISADLNIPYLLWCLFATYLTIGIYLLN